MEQDAPKRRDRLMGKFFGGKDKDRKYTSEQSANDISAFLGNSDKLQISHPPPPPPSQGHREYERQQPTLALDTSRATRYPAALDVENNRSQQSLAYRTRSHSPPRRKNKGLVVRFADSYPEIIGEGGDECQTVVAEIGKRKRSKSAPTSAPIPPTKQGHEYARQVGAFQEVKPSRDEGFVPGPIRRTQTGFSTVSDLRDESASAPAPAPPMPTPPQPRTVPAGETSRSRFLDSSNRKDENRRSFIELHQQEQRQAEGIAFAQAMRSTGENSQHEWDDQGQASSPETQRDSPAQTHRKEIPAAMDEYSSGASRSQSTKVPASRGPGHEPPTRSQSTRAQMSPPMPDDYTRTQPPLAPPRNPARRSPFSPVPPYDHNASSRGPSPVPPPYPQEAPPVFRNESLRSQRTISPDELRLNTSTSNLVDSPSSTYSQSMYSTPDLSHKATFGSQSPEKPNRQFHDIVVAAGEDAYEDFIERTKHLYELFRLHAEQFRALGSCQPMELCRAALWWFLKGRTSLETAIRSQANSDDQKNLMTKYQAYTDLTKGYWLTELALPEIADGKYSPVEGELGEIRQTLKANLKKLAVSMKRNGFLPPEEPFMPQHMDKAIWVQYPALSQDVVSMLNGNWGSVLAASRQSSRTLEALEALPIGDTPQYFSYGRVPAEVYLMEQGMESMDTCFSCILSIVRPTHESNLVFIVASQNGSVGLKIQSDKNVGASWDSVRWRSDSNTLEVKMPRGFILAIKCSQQDFRMLWNIFDFGAKVQSYLYPRKEEAPNFRTKLRGFHYFDADPKSRTFPKEPVGQCEVAIFERILKEGSPTGPRNFHRGFRLAVVTGPKTRTLSGVTHFYTPQMPIQFAYLRGEQREPMLQLAYKDTKDNCRMVLSFNDDGEREKLVSLLKGTYVHHDEEVIAEVTMQGFNVTEGLGDTKGGFPALQKLPWQIARIINDRYSGDVSPTVLAEKLRLEIDSLDSQGAPVGTITDRINMAPGEFKVRLDTKDILALQVLRHPQLDMTVSIMDKPGLTDAPREFTALQNSIARSETVRTYRFSSFRDLHAFQAAITGYNVLFDGVASSLNIARRRMVVPVYKKWESGTARIQVVQSEKTVQLLAFFENWSHGQCMGFVLKGTDVFESSGRGHKSQLKMVDCKFPLPKIPDEEGTKTDDMAFVCLDMPDYAGEHDDITIVFEDENERDRLCSCLPAPVKGARATKVGSKG
ncbi:uncharacterized protein BCR38DRAFT_173823 [Pseudomassariella vexata]|uniref:Uncharacterized protein n=1 Tax=Pseudomassariella vexata TaxID=1141098 RepID=A0A1Y2E4C6_9PEZI|nr:uncharacterized protein BCR38DRAFT_173823 [Pseudomassariella vexata]ORY66146.1 hypothetical protein BCR38DRAFT_173823 [Pseudomassariella vexata]